MHNPAHPGELLHEYIPRQMSVSTAARRMGVKRSVLSKILYEKAPVTAEMALRLSVWLDTSPEVWIDMQAAWDLWQAERFARC